MRIGHGYDVHKFENGRKCIICGVDIPCQVGLAGHSDADVAVHALMDAMLGAAALGDIGRHFPDNDDAYKGISSLVLLDKVTQLLFENGYKVSNADITIIAQQPKMAPHISKMEKNLASHMQIPVENVNVKATTEEGLGFTGACLGIAAHAVVLIDNLGI
ncbi:MAG: 2-C-methyl-D-erythritol 2,4-cyclodiphosphate synthase [Oscillospiraceae bacterium]